ncbi:MAG: 50S ribosomal protein L6 [Granulosicoccaceae bacterium]|jgi:large subunit ribosomal protein L6
MSRIANKPVEIPSGVEVNITGQEISVKGSNGTLARTVHDFVEMTQEDNAIKFVARSNEKKARAMAGTMRSLVNNMVVGVSKGFEKKMELVGVGYRAQAQGKTLNLTLGLSHPVAYAVPEGVTVETPSQTEILVKGADNQLVGHVCAEIRAWRPPEPYKGKGIRFAGEHIARKEAKKK